MPPPKGRGFKDSNKIDRLRSTIYDTNTPGSDYADLEWL